MQPLKRRKFLQWVTAFTAGTSLTACQSLTPSNHRKPIHVMGLVADKLKTVKVGFIGVGERGSYHVWTLSNIEGVELSAICDIDSISIDKTLALLKDKNIRKPTIYTGHDYAYRDMLEKENLDIVIISTPWRWHTVMCVEAMNSGCHAMVEVPAAVSIDECWQLVEVSEKTQLNCMMLENVCYGREELMVLNMVRQGLFGELLHGEAAYIHELRWQMKHLKRSTGSWRTSWHSKHQGNLYPTHGLGPIAQYMNINRGDRFDYLVSISSPALGRAMYAKENFPSDHFRNKAQYINGDINTSIIKTARGRSIMVQHDTTSPRPYSRHNLIQGTEGAFAGFPARIALESSGSYHEWDYDMEAWFKKYDHPLWTRLSSQALENGGHGGMDFVMMWRLIYCLRNGEPLDQNVYDAAAWSCINTLSDISVRNRGQRQDIPDFTRGLWKTAKPLGIIR